MSKAKAGIRKIPIPQLIQVSSEVYKKMDGNAYFPDPNPSLGSLGKAIEDLGVAYQQAINRGKILKQVMYIADKNLRWHINQLAAYVTTASNGVEKIILTSGFQVSSTSRGRKPVATVQNLHSLSANFADEAKLRWKPVKNSRVYIVQFTQTPDDEKSWQQADVCIKASTSIRKLKARETYWFRVAALGSLGRGAWSNPATRFGY